MNPLSSLMNICTSLRRNRTMLSTQLVAMTALILVKWWWQEQAKLKPTCSTLCILLIFWGISGKTLHREWNLPCFFYQEIICIPDPLEILELEKSVNIAGCIFLWAYFSQTQSSSLRLSSTTPTMQPRRNHDELTKISSTVLCFLTNYLHSPATTGIYQLNVFSMKGNSLECMNDVKFTTNGGINKFRAQ